MRKAGAGPSGVFPRGQPPRTHPGLNYGGWREHAPDVHEYAQWNSVWTRFPELEELQLFRCEKKMGNRKDPLYSFSGCTVIFSGPAKILTEYKSPAQHRDGKRACAVEEGQGEQEASCPRRKRGKELGQSNVFHHKSSQALREAGQPGHGGAWQPDTHGGQQMLITPDTQEAGMDKQSLEDNLLAANDQEVQAQQCVVDKLKQELQHLEEACKDLEVRTESLVKLQAFLETAQDNHDDPDVSESTRAAAAQVLAKYKVLIEDEGDRRQAAQAAAQKLPALSQDLKSARLRLRVLTARRVAAHRRWKELSAFNEQHWQQRQ